MQNYSTILIFLAFVLNTTSVVSAQEMPVEPQYLSAVLASTAKKKASYYRVNEGRDGERFVGKTYSMDGKLKAEGRYLDEGLNVEHGPFVFFHANGKVESKGDYEKGNKAGVWLRFDQDGRSLAEKVYDPEPLANIIYSRAQTMPQYADGGDRAFVKYVKEKAGPTEGKRMKGAVTTSFVVEKNGELTDVKVVEGAGEPHDSRVVDAVKSTSPWVPGADKGQPVRVQMKVPVQF